MFTRLMTALAVLAFSLSRAGAQEIVSGQPLIGSTATVAEPAVENDQQTDGFYILAIGDALGGGLGAGLTRMVELEDGFNVTLRFNEESGIARPEVYDWSERLPKILDGKTYDAIVVLLGANDRQTIRSGDQRYEFNTPEWIAAYKVQTDRILDALMVGGSKVYWISIPPMGDAYYQAAMQDVAQIQKERVEAKGAVFVEIRPAFLDANGKYTDTGTDETGIVRKLRGRDGVSFFKQGNNRLAQLVLAAIKKGGTEKPATEQPAIAEITLAEPGHAAEPMVPLFSQLGSDSNEASFRPEIIGGGAGSTALQALAAPGSSAEKLFVAGQSDKSPPGRADDFSVTK